jgi:hypothetical protein
LKNKIPIQMGLMNQYSEFPSATGGFFLQAGNPKGVTLIFGESGGSLALRYNFLK